MKIYIFIISFLFSIIITTNQSAKELLVYADSINYDAKKSIIAKGNVKLISGDEILTSNLIIINEKDKEILLPEEFQYKDEDENYYFGSSGKFTSNFNNAYINNLKILLNDGTRIVGKEGYKTGKIDLINKGVYSPCESKINIKNFICPIWQVDGEKILHDRENLFIHQKHSKLRLFNIPVFYFPYIVAPSPLRKKRKSGFLTPRVNFNFFDTRASQSTSFPYYFALDEDKELLITPTINYGGGVDASQNITYEYNQIISGGYLDIDASTDTNFENQNNESWLLDSSIITNFKKNINEKFTVLFSSAFQSSPTFLRRTDKNNFLNRSNTLSTTLNLNGYNVREFDDRLNFNVSGYQVVKNNEDNKTTPTTLPYITYSFGDRSIQKTKYKNNLTFYNIFRDSSTDDHAQRQQKFSHVLMTDNEFYSHHSKFNFKTEFHSQFFNTEKIKINSIDHSGSYERFFPMTGLFLETPLVDNQKNLFITPKISLIINGSQPNSNEISNEESTNNAFNLLNNNLLNRYTGSDKLDNSQRINFGVEIFKNNLFFEFGQSYEFNNENNFNKENGLNNYLSDILGLSTYNGKNNIFEHNFRFNTDQKLIKSQDLSYTNKNKIGDINFSYVQERVENNSILENGTESLKVSFLSKEFYDYSTVNFNSSFDLIKDDPTKYNIGYNYFDECFGVTIDFERSFYEDRDLKPKDILTLMFSFKHLGAFKSSNLAVSEIDKQNIKWTSGNIENEQFK